MRNFPGSGANNLSDGNAASLDITGLAVSVSAWFRAETIDGSERQIASKGENLSVRVQYKLRLHSAGIAFQIGNGASFDSIQSSFTPQIGQYRHACATYNGTRMDLYIDGKRNVFGASTRSIASGGWNFKVGQQNDNVGPFDGDIFQVAVWAAGLIPDEVHRIYNGVSPLNIRPGQLRGYFPLDDYGSSGGSYDRSRHRANLSMVGTVGFTSTPMQFFDVALNVAMKSTQENPHGVFGGGSHRPQWKSG